MGYCNHLESVIICYLFTLQSSFTKPLHTFLSLLHEFSLYGPPLILCFDTSQNSKMTTNAGYTVIWIIQDNVQMYSFLETNLKQYLNYLQCAFGA